MAAGDQRYEVAMAREEIGDTDGGTLFAVFKTDLLVKSHELEPVGRS